MILVYDNTSMSFHLIPSMFLKLIFQMLMCNTIPNVILIPSPSVKKKKKLLFLFFLGSSMELSIVLLISSVLREEKVLWNGSFLMGMKGFEVLLKGFASTFVFVAVLFVGLLCLQSFRLKKKNH